MLLMIIIIQPFMKSTKDKTTMSFIPTIKPIIRNFLIKKTMLHENNS